jgi:OOP family OmpA-OmpF porin
LRDSFLSHFCYWYLFETRPLLIMRFKSIFCSLLIIVSFAMSVSVFAQDPANLMVKLSGKILTRADSTPIKARILFEKLPYYDDMGMASTVAEGKYELYLLKGFTYNLKVTASGFEAKEIQYVVKDEEGIKELLENFFLEISEERRLIVLENLNFDSGRAGIRSESFEELDRLAEWIKARPQIMIQLEGHTDFEGNANANLKLSQDRVEAVKEYLGKKGVNKSQVLTKAFGGTEPLTQDRSAEAKASNRRVEVRVLDK